MGSGSAATCAVSTQCSFAWMRRAAHCARRLHHQRLSLRLFLCVLRRRSLLPRVPWPLRLRVRSPPPLLPPAALRLAALPHWCRCLRLQSALPSAPQAFGPLPVRLRLRLRLRLRCSLLTLQRRRGRARWQCRPTFRCLHWKRTTTTTRPTPTSCRERPLPAATGCDTNMSASPRSTCWSSTRRKR